MNPKQLKVNTDCHASINANGGFTLVETVIALAVVSIALVVLMAAFDKSMLSAAHSSALTRAVMLASEKIALVGDSKLPPIGISEWQDDNRYPRFRYRTKIGETPFKDARQVTVTVKMDEREIFLLDSYILKK